jgi:hypothetical protein
VHPAVLVQASTVVPTTLKRVGLLAPEGPSDKLVRREGSPVATGSTETRREGVGYRPGMADETQILPTAKSGPKTFKKGGYHGSGKLPAMQWNVVHLDKPHLPPSQGTFDLLLELRRCSRRDQQELRPKTYGREA